MKQRSRRKHLSRADRLRFKLRAILSRYLDNRGNLQSPAGLVRAIKELL